MEAINLKESLTKSDYQERNEAGISKKEKIQWIMCSSAIIASSISCITIFLIYSECDGPIRVRNNFIGLWLSIVLFLLVILKFSANFGLTASRIYYSAGMILSLIQFICFLMAKNKKVWEALISLAILIWSAYSVLDKKKYIFLLNEKFDKLSWKIFIQVIAIFMQMLVLLIMILLTVGSIKIGGLTATYPARGKFLQVQLASDNSKHQTVHQLCDGPQNSTYPIFIFEADDSHGFADYLGLQSILNTKNLRSCIWDKPGLGQSDLLYNDLKKESNQYHNLITKLSEIEKPPFSFVGWGGGAQIIYEYAADHPEQVDSLVFLDASWAKGEWLIPKILKGWTEEQYIQNMMNDINQRKTLFRLINSIGVPFGLMSIFLPAKQSNPIQFSNERKWYFETDETWVTQQNYVVNHQANDPDPILTKSIQKRIPLHVIITAQSDKQVIDLICIKIYKYDPSSADCKYQIEANNFNINIKKNFTRLSEGGKVVECKADECDLGYYVYDNPSWTIDALIGIYKKV